MPSALKKFIIRQLKIPSQKNSDEDIKWVCNSLGFMGARDKDHTAYRIVKALAKEAKKGKGLTSEELTRKVQPTIGAVIYHLNNLRKAGLVVKLGPLYELRMNSLLLTINEIEKDILSTMDNMKRIAMQIDSSIGLENR